MYYNGWKMDHYLSNLFVFAPDGKIIFCLLNAPGSLHDSTLAECSNLYQLLNDVFVQTGGQCCMDSAFVSKNNPAVIKKSDHLNHASYELEMITMIQATSLQQSAEWGMHPLQSAFPRIKQTIKFDETEERKYILMAITLLHNYRCSKVGLNQIQNVYASHLVKDPSELYFE